MRDDRRGLAVTTESADAVAHLDRAIASVLGHRRDAGDHLGRALAVDPGLVAGHCLAGFAQLLLARGELVERARQSAAAAARFIAERGGTAREHRLCRALGAWLAGDMARCATILEDGLAAAPLDALVFKLVHGIRFMLGDAAGMRRASALAVPAWTPEIPESGFVLGCHAFALEETGALDAAERAGRAAIEREPLDAWGCHAVAHVFEMKRRPIEGLAWLAAHRGKRSELNNFARHLAWHEALFRLARREFDAVLALYDAEIRDAPTDDYRDIANAASLLWRLERGGVRVGPRWDELADLAERRIGDPTLVFAQLHYLMSLVGAGRLAAVASMRQAMRRAAVAGRGTQAGILAGVGLALAELVRPRGSGAPAAGSVWLLRTRLAAIGGSRAQRAVFEGMIDDGAARTRLAVPAPLRLGRVRRAARLAAALPEAG